MNNEIRRRPKAETKETQERSPPSTDNTLVTNKQSITQACPYYFTITPYVNCLFASLHTFSWVSSSSLQILNSTLGYVLPKKQVAGGPASQPGAPIDLDNIKKTWNEFASIRYDPENQQHENLLEFYWKTCFQNQPFERKSKKWGDIGFQGTDPASDFRGAGIFGLRCLVYFSIFYPEIFTAMLRGDGKKSDQENYPLSIAGLNVIMIINDILGWGFKKMNKSAKAKTNASILIFHPSNNESKSVQNLLEQRKKQLVRQFSSISLFEYENPEVELMYYEVFCYTFALLNKTWYETDKVGYMSFPVVLEKALNKLASNLENLLTTPEKLFHSLMG